MLPMMHECSGCGEMTGLQPLKINGEWKVGVKCPACGTRKALLQQALDNLDDTITVICTIAEWHNKDKNPMLSMMIASAGKMLKITALIEEGDETCFH